MRSVKLLPKGTKTKTQALHDEADFLAEVFREVAIAGAKTGVPNLPHRLWVALTAVLSAALRTTEEGVIKPHH